MSDDEIKRARALASLPGIMPSASQWIQAQRLLLLLVKRVEVAEAEIKALKNVDKTEDEP